MDTKIILLCLASLILCAGCTTADGTRYRFIVGLGWIKSTAQVTETKALGVTVTHPPGLTVGYLSQRDISLPAGTNLILEIK